MLNPNEVVKSTVAQYRQDVADTFGFSKMLDDAAKAGQLVLVGGKKLLLIDNNNAADISFTPEEAFDADYEVQDGFTVVVGDLTVEVVSSRSASEALTALVEFANTYDMKKSILRRLLLVSTALGEAAFEGFSEGATLEDVCIFYADKLNLTIEDVTDLMMHEMMTGHTCGINLSKLRVAQEVVDMQ